MSSALSLEPQNLIQVISEQWPRVDEPGMVELWELLKATCIDVAQSGATSPGALADRALYIARIEKLISTPVKPGEEPTDTTPLRSSPPLKLKFRDDAFGDVRTYPKANYTTLENCMSLKPAYTNTQLKDLRQDLLSRCSSRLPRNLGRLLKYNSILHDADDLDQRRHVYLFEKAIVILRDASLKFKPLTRSDQRLNVIRTIAISDIELVNPAQGVFSPSGFYSLELRTTPPVPPIGLRGLATAASWAVDIERLRYRAASMRAHTTLNKTTEDQRAFEAFAAVMQTESWHISTITPLNGFGRLILHAEVVVRDRLEHSAKCGALLFEHGLLFLRGSPPGPPQPIFWVVHSRVKHIYQIDRGCRFVIGCAYSTQYEDHLLIEPIVFELPTDAHRSMWKRELLRLAPHIDPSAPVYWETSQLALPTTLSPSSSAAPTPEVKFSGNVAGLVFLTSTPVPTEHNLSIAVRPGHQSMGCATYAIARTLEFAFDVLHAHRVQVRVVHSATNPEQTARAVRKFLHLGFAHEGVRRRAVRHPSEGCWADMSVLAMIELDWVTRERNQPFDHSLWDEMFARHEREREGLRRAENLRRSRSTDTIRDLRAFQEAAPTPSMMSRCMQQSRTSRDTVSSVVSAASTTDGVRSLSSAPTGADDAADDYIDWDLYDEGDDEDGEIYADSDEDV